MKSLIIIFLLRLISFIVFANLNTGEEFEQTKFEGYVNQLKEFNNHYEINLTNEDKTTIGYIKESLKKNEDSILYNLNLTLSEAPEYIEDIVKISGYINFLKNGLINDFYFRIGKNYIFKGKLDKHRQENILVTFENTNNQEKKSRLISIKEFNINLIFSKFLPYIDFKKNNKKSFELISPISLIQKGDINTVETFITKKNKRKYTIQNNFLGIDTKSTFIFDKKNNLKKQKNPFFEYNIISEKKYQEENTNKNNIISTKSDNNKTSKNEESNNKKLEKLKNDIDSEVEKGEKNLKCKIIGND